MNNSLYDIDFTFALPPTLKQDDEMLSLARIIAGELQENIRLARLNIIYARIDKLPENVLDILAYDFHVDWYDYSYPVSVKRQIIKDSVKVHKRLGTKYAVETVLSNVFQKAWVSEWYEYGGRPYYFRINIDVSESGASIKENKELIRQIFFYKNLRSWIDEISYQAVSKPACIYTGSYHKVGTHITVHPYLPRSVSSRSDLYTGSMASISINLTNERGAFADG